MDIAKINFIPFNISCLNIYHLKMTKMCNFRPVATFMLPWKPNETQNQTSVCATFQVCIDALYAALTKICTYVFVGHFIPLIKAFFFQICYCVAILLAMGTVYKKHFTFLFLFI